MSDLLFGLRLTADAGGFVGTVRISRDELERLDKTARTTGQGARAMAEGTEHASRKAAEGADSLRRLNREGQNTVDVYGRMRSAIAATAAALGLGQIVAAADAWNLYEGRLRLVTDSEQELARTQAQVFQLAQDTRQAYEPTVSLYSRMAKSADQYNLSTTQQLAITKAINQAFKISGASSSEAAAGILQLSQGFSAGVLAGDEFKSVSENASRVMDVLAAHLNVTRGELKAMAAEGKITGQILAEAFLGQAGTLQQEFEKLPVLVSEALTTLRNELLRAIGLGDEASGFSQQLVAAIEELRGIVASPEFAEFARIMGDVLVGGVRLVVENIEILRDVLLGLLIAKAAEWALSFANGLLLMADNLRLALPYVAALASPLGILVGVTTAFAGAVSYIAEVTDPTAAAMEALRQRTSELGAQLDSGTLRTVEQASAFLLQAEAARSAAKAQIDLNRAMREGLESEGPESGFAASLHGEREAEAEAELRRIEAMIADARKRRDDLAAGVERSSNSNSASLDATKPIADFEAAIAALNREQQQLIEQLGVLGEQGVGAYEKVAASQKASAEASEFAKDALEKANLTQEERARLENHLATLYLRNVALKAQLTEKGKEHSAAESAAAQASKRQAELLERQAEAVAQLILDSGRQAEAEKLRYEATLAGADAVARLETQLAVYEALVSAEVIPAELSLAEAMALINDSTDARVVKIRESIAAAETYKAKTGELTKSLRDSQEAEKRLADERAALLRRPIENALDSLQDSFRGFWQSVLDGGVSSFRDLAEQLKSIGTRLVSELITLFAFNPGAIGSLFGGGGALPGGGSLSVGGVQSGGSGVGGFFGTLGRALGSQGAGASWLQQSSIMQNNAAARGLANMFPSAAGGIGQPGGFDLLGFLGEVGIGTTLGSFAGSLVGGGPMASSIGGAVGSAIGSFIPIPGAGAIGGLLGGLLGGLFGKKKEPIGPRSNAEIRMLSGLDIKHAGQLKGAGDPSPFADSIIDATNSIVAALGGELGSGKVTVDVGTVPSLGGIFVNPTGIYDGTEGIKKHGTFFGEDQDAARRFAISTILSQAGTTGIDPRALAAAQKSLEIRRKDEDVERDLGVIKLLFEAEETAKGAAGALRDLNEQFDEAKTRARELGLAEAMVEEKRAEAIAALKEGFLGSLQDQILGFKDPTALALKRLDEEFAQMRLDAQALGVGLVEVEELYALRRQEVLEQALSRGNDRLRQLLDELDFGSLGGAALGERLSGLRATLQASGAQALAGDSAARERFLDLAPELLKLSNQANAGTTDFFADKEYVRSILLSLADGAPGFASGTSSAPRGLIRLAERGGAELVVSPGGHQVINALETRRLLANDNQRGAGEGFGRAAVERLDDVVAVLRAIERQQQRLNRRIDLLEARGAGRRAVARSAA